MKTIETIFEGDLLFRNYNDQRIFRLVIDSTDLEAGVLVSWPDRRNLTPGYCAVCSLPWLQSSHLKISSPDPKT